MTRPRTSDSGLPDRLYEYRGLRTYSIGYKSPDNTWLFRDRCAADDKQQVRRLRRDAIARVSAMGARATEIETVGALIDDWLEWQLKLPETSLRKRAASTFAENSREAMNLRRVFAEVPIASLRPCHGYAYLEKCEQLERSAKGNKEIALLQAILKRAIQKGIIDVNPMDEVDKLPTAPSTRYVEDDELKLALDVGRAVGGASLIAALALNTAYLCIRRSVEALDLQRHQIVDDGIEWTSGKRTRKDFERKVLIAWSPELRATIDEALALPRNDNAGPYVFGNLDGQRYTKGGWKSNLGRLMDACERRAKIEGKAFRRFSLQDLRPKGVSDKLQAGHGDVVDATLHTNERMVQTVYDRRRKRTARPAR